MKNAITLKEYGLFIRKGDAIVNKQADRVDGVEYMTDKEVIEAARSGELEKNGIRIGVYAAKDANNISKQIAPVPYEYMTTAEKKVYGSQKCTLGPNKGKTLEELELENE